MRVLLLGAALAALSVSSVQAASAPALQPSTTNSQGTVIAGPPRDPNEPQKLYVGAEAVQALIANAKARRTNETNVIQRLLHAPPYDANLEYRAAAGGANLHEKDAELFYVVDGKASFTTGGTLVDPARTSPTDLRGTSIVGGDKQTVSKGDFMIVPKNTPHWFHEMGDRAIVLMAIHIPGG